MMPPLAATLHVARNGKRFRIWLPLFLVWLIVLPFALVTVPVVVMVLALLGRHPLRVFAAAWSVLCATPGSRIEVNDRRGFVFLQVH